MDNYRRVIKVEDQPSDDNHPSSDDNHPHDAGDEGKGGGSKKRGWAKNFHKKNIKNHNSF